MEGAKILNASNAIVFVGSSSIPRGNVHCCIQFVFNEAYQFPTLKAVIDGLYSIINTASSFHTIDGIVIHIYLLFFPHETSKKGMRFVWRFNLSRQHIQFFLNQYSSGLQQRALRNDWSMNIRSIDNRTQYKKNHRITWTFKSRNSDVRLCLNWIPL